MRVFHTARTIKTAPTVEPGMKIRASDALRVRDALKVLTDRPFLNYWTNERSWAENMLHAVATIENDYLTCYRLWRNLTLGSELVYVAKPERLRHEASRDGVTYAYSTPQQRTASKSGEDDETQIVTPIYLVGDVIQVVMQRGPTGIPLVDGQRAFPVDNNFDGRAWAGVPPSP